MLCGDCKYVNLLLEITRLPHTCGHSEVSAIEKAWQPC